MTTSLHRRSFLGLGAGAAAALVLAACGDDAGTATAGTGAPGNGRRTVVADNGPVEVPADPQRVVAAIGSFEIDMVALGVMPVLTTGFAGPWVKLDPSVTVTANVPPTAEEMAKARPDLIVGWTWVTGEPVHDDYLKLAPYVGLGESEATAGPGGVEGAAAPYESWNKLFLSVADAVNRRPTAERLIGELDRRIAAVAGKRKGRPPLRVARVEFFEPGLFSYRGQNEDTAELMRRIGLTVVGPDRTENETSIERLPEIDADVIVVPVGGTSNKADTFAEIARNPLWQAVPAVKAGRVHQVDGALWPGLGHLWARAMVDELERLFAS